ncbi:hypothetical protein [Hymenobacter sp. UYP22]|uniref:hypothetical protein n=1 Tax=Hymenobacter sp. UYP22 TaxID=3156348 RepID=UPI0033992C78
MRILLLALGLALTLPAAHAQTPVWTDAVQPTDSRPTDGTGALGRGITVDAAGNQYVTGVLNNSGGSGAPAVRVFGSTTFAGGSGLASGFIAKLSPTQQWQWALRATSDGEGATFQESAVSPAGDTYGVGLVFGDANMTTGGTTLTVGTYTYTTTKYFASFITRLNASGQPQWLAGVSGAQIYSSGWDATAGNLVVAGTYSGTVTVGATTLPTAPSTGGLFVARLNAAGQWVSAVGVPNTGTASTSRFVVSKVAVGPQGQAAIAFRIRNGSITLGSTTINSISTTQAISVVAQLNAANQWTWATQTPAAGSGSVAYVPSGLQYDRAGNIWLAAEAPSTDAIQLGSATVTDASFTARLSSAGQWSALGTIGRPSSISNPYVAALAVDGQGNPVILGSLPGTGTFTFGSRSVTNTASNSNFVARYNPTTTAWDYAQLTPAAGGDGYSFEAAAIDGAGTLTATGMLRGSATFGFTTLTNAAANGNNVFVARLSGAGLITAVRQAVGLAPLTVYPNPAGAGAATLRLPVAATAARPLLLRDALGRVVRQATIQAGQQEIPLPTAGLRPGMYVAETSLHRAQIVIE